MISPSRILYAINGNALCGRLDGWCVTGLGGNMSAGNFPVGAGARVAPYQEAPPDCSVRSQEPPHYPPNTHEGHWLGNYSVLVDFP